MNTDFKMLKVFSALFKVAAWILLLVIGGVGSVAVLMQGGGEAAQAVPKWTVLLNLLTGLFWFLIFYTVAEVIKLLLAIEAQGRGTSKPA